MRVDPAFHIRSRASLPAQVVFSATQASFPKRSPEFHLRAIPGTGLNREASAEPLSPASEVMQAMSGTGPLGIEPPAVVDDLQDYSFAFDSQIDLDDASPGMAGHVVDGLLEHEKQLAAYIRFQFAAS